jgi:hypothetical protein
MRIGRSKISGLAALVAMATSHQPASAATTTFTFNPCCHHRNRNSNIHGHSQLLTWHSLFCIIQSRCRSNIRHRQSCRPRRQYFSFCKSGNINRHRLRRAHPKRKTECQPHYDGRPLSEQFFDLRELLMRFDYSQESQNRPKTHTR